MRTLPCPSAARGLTLAAASLLACSAVHGGDYPLWEIGAGMAVLHLPDYRGSEVTDTHLLPIPYLRYRGEFLRADRDGLRGLLYEGERVELNLSVNATPPADSSDNPARAGMADLEPTVEIGPTLDLNLWRSADRRRALAFRLPLRAAITVESSPQHVGWLLWPNLKFESRDPPGLPGWDFDAQAGPIFSDRSYNRHFYGVGVADATPGRPAYDPGSGYAGSQFAVSLNKRFARYWVGAGLRYEHLGGAVFLDSPLVGREHALSLALALSWVLAESSTRVEAEQ